MGRLALCRVHHGTIRRGQTVAWCRRDGSVENVRVTELYVTEGLARTAADEAGPGEIIALAGFPDITIGETIADAADPQPLPVIAVEEPALGVTIGTNTSPLAGRSGDRLTARQVQDRLNQELVGNVAIRVLEIDRRDTWEVQGRGELQLAVLVEAMRREGFELTVGKPQVVTREVDGELHEPIERLSIDVPDDFLGVVTQMLALRKGRMTDMVNHGTGWVRLEFLVPTRGLIGFRTEFLTETRGSGILHSVFEGYEPWQGDISTRPTGSLVADRPGPTATFALLKMQERGQLFVGPGEEVYEGMVVGENARSGDLDVNAVREKKLTNMRAAGSDETVKLVPHHRLSSGSGSWSSSARTRRWRSPPTPSAYAKPSSTPLRGSSWLAYASNRRCRASASGRVRIRPVCGQPRKYCCRSAPGRERMGSAYASPLVARRCSRLVGRAGAGFSERLCSGRGGCAGGTGQHRHHHA